MHRFAPSSGTRSIVALLVVSLCGAALIAAPAARADDAPLAATASVSSGAEYLGDTAGTTFTMTVQNTGTVGIGSVEIDRPSASWTITACPAAPTGWVTALFGTMCRYRSTRAPADDLAPGVSSSAFEITATTAAGKVDAVGTWKVRISKTLQLAPNHDPLAAAALPPGGLGATAHAFEVTDAVVAAGSAAAGDPCPTPNKSAVVSSTNHTVAICGYNRSAGSLRPLAAGASLAGSFIASATRFSSALIPPTAIPVVLAVWRKVTISSTLRSNDSVLAAVVAGANHTSPPTELDGYDAHVNTAPVAVPDVATVSADSTGTPIDVLGNDTDADGDQLKVASVNTTGTLGTVTNNGTNVTYSANGAFASLAPGQTATDTFRYRVADPNGGVASTTVTVTITGVDDPPVAVDDSATVLHDSDPTAIDVLANDTDIDGGPKTISAAGDPDHGTVVLAGGTAGAATGLTYQPDAGYCNTDASGTPDTFTYTVNGGSTGTVSVTVTCPNNQPPTAVADVATVSEDDTGTVIDVLGNDTDPNGDPLTVTAVDTTGTFGVVTNNGTNVTYDPAGQFDTLGGGQTATDTFTYTISDGQGGTSSATVTVTITGVDDPPVAVDDSATVLHEADPTPIDVLGNDTDIDGGPLTIAAASDPANGTVVLTGGTDGAATGLTYQPDAGYCNTGSGAPDTFTYTLNGGSTATVSMTVTCGDATPILFNVEADALTYTENDPPTQVTATATLTDNDSSDFDGGSLTVDLFNGGRPEDVLGIANQGSDAGLIGVVDDTVTFGGVQIGTFTGGTALTPLVVTLNSSATPAATQSLIRAITYADTSDDPATHLRTIRFVVDDGDGATSFPVSRGVVITAVDDPPVAVDDTWTVLENEPASPVNIDSNDTDIDGGPQVIIAASDPANGTVALTGGDASGATGLTYQPDPGYCDSNPGGTPDPFTYTLNGGSTATVFVTVICTGTTAPVIASIEAPALTYTENAAPTPITATGTITDSDSTNFNSGRLTVDFSAGGQAEDVLAIRDQGTGAGQIGLSVPFITFGGLTIGRFSGGTGGTPLVILFTTDSATPAAAQALLRNITYADTSDAPSAATRTVRFVVTDGDLGASAPATRAVTVKPVDDAPVITIPETSPLPYTENDPATLLTATGTVTDVDSANFDTGTLTASVATNGQAEDRLAIANQGTGAGQIGVSGTSITFGGVAIGTFNGATALVITLNANATPVVTQALLRDITYADVSDNPNTATRTIRFVLTDGDGGTSTAVTRNVTVTAVNDKPVIAGVEGTALGYTENALPPSITSTGTVTDVDSSNFSTGTLTVGFSSGGQAEDRVAVRNQGTGGGQIGVTGTSVTLSGTVIGTFTGGVGTTPLVITLNASATVAATQALLRQIGYSDVSDSPSTVTRVASVVLTDGDGGTSATVTRMITVKPVDDPPVIAGIETTTLTATENVPVAITATATVTDVDSPSTDAGTLTVDFPVGGLAEDRLTVGNQGTNPNQFGVSGNSITFSGTPFGTFTGGVGTTPLVVTFTTIDLPFVAQLLVRDITYNDGSNTPSAATHTVRFVLADGGGAASAAVTRNVVVTPVDDAPVISGIESTSLSYTENEGATLVTATSTVTDPDSSNFNTGTLTVSITTNGHTEDRLAILNQGTGAGQIGVSGSTVTFAGTSIGAFTGGSGTTSLVITLNAAATPTATQALTRAITYADVSDAPFIGPRTVRFVLSDGAGGTSVAATRTVTITAVDDAPVLTATTGSTVYKAFSTGVVVDGGLTLADVDSTNESGATVSVVSPVAGDTLTFTTQGSITGVYASGVLTLTGSGTLAQYQAVLRSVKFTNLSNGTLGSRQIDFRIAGPLASNTASKAVTIIANAVFVAQAGTNTGDCSDAASPCATVSYALTKAVANATINVSGTIHDNIVVHIPVTITGVNAPAGAPAVIDGSADGTPVINVGQPATLDHLTIQNGSASNGAGIIAQDPVTITNSVVTGNAAGASGGGLQTARSVPAVIDHTVFSGNTATGSLGGAGGAVDAGGNLTVTNSTFSGNSAHDFGGAINSSSGGFVHITGSTFVQNSTVTPGDGGALYGSTSVLITASTFTQNSSGFGTAIFIATGGANILQSTFSANGTRTVLTASAGATIALVGDVMDEPVAVDCSTPFASFGYSVFSDSSCGPTGPGDKVVTGPLVAPLHDNGGATQTMAPLGAGPVVGVIPVGTSIAMGGPATTFCPTVDQRGVASTPGVACDAGAVQYAKPVLAGIEGSTLTYTENGPPTLITGTTTVSGDSGVHLSNAALFVDFSTGGLTEDRLAVFNQGTGAGQIGVSGSTVTYGGVQIATFTGGNGTPLTFTMGAGNSVAATQALVRDITYNDTSPTPLLLVPRTVRFRLFDISGGASAPVTRNITIAP